MKRHRSSALIICMAVFLLSFFARNAEAYIGPGTGLTAIGAFLALIVGVLVAIFGFVWYPVKRLLRKNKRRSKSEDGGGE